MGHSCTHEVVNGKAIHITERKADTFMKDFTFTFPPYDTE